MQYSILKWRHSWCDTKCFHVSMIRHTALFSQVLLKHMALSCPSVKHIYMDFGCRMASAWTWYKEVRMSGVAYSLLTRNLASATIWYKCVDMLHVHSSLPQWPKNKSCGAQWWGKNWMRLRAQVYVQSALVISLTPQIKIPTPPYFCACMPPKGVGWGAPSLSP